MPYHVRLWKDIKSEYCWVRDLTKEDVEKRFAAPYREDRIIVASGRRFKPSEIEEVKIVYTNDSSEILLSPRQKRVNSDGYDYDYGLEDEPPRWHTVTPDESELLQVGRDVTDEFIFSPPLAQITAAVPHVPTDTSDPKKVFVVHGRNGKARDAMFAFLRSIGLDPLEWSEARKRTGKTSPYVGDILDSAFAISRAVVVLMTGDDEARLREHLCGRHEPPHEVEITPQARPNVLFEAGMAMGRNPERTVLVELGQLRPFSDIAGRHTVRMDDSTQRRQELAMRLQTAGCSVNLDGVDWHTAGKFRLSSVARKRRSKRDGDSTESASEDGDREPFRIPRIDDPSVREFQLHYAANGYEVSLPRSYERDVLIAKGYSIACRPGTKREVWVGYNPRNDSYEHIMVLKPAKESQ